MTTVLVWSPQTALPDWLRAALEGGDGAALPMRVALVVHDSTALVQACRAAPPDVLLCWFPQPIDAGFSLLQAAAPACAVLAFVQDPLGVGAEQGTAAGVHLYRTDPCTAADLPALMRIAQARFQQDQTMQRALNEATWLLEERKVVDRAKLILMQARHLSDDDAFRLLRTASMHSNQRLGQVGQHIIHTARFAEGVNRAGQLRMLSQRLLMLYLLELAQPTAALRALRRDAAERIDANLAWLGAKFSDPALAAGVHRVLATWQRLRDALQPPAPRQPLMDPVQMDDLAEQLLQDAERLTAQLKEAGAAAPLQVLNLAGRQRMLTQRYAKAALLGAVGHPVLAPRSAGLMADTRADYDAAMHYLNNAPLSSPDIRSALAQAKTQWQHMLAGAQRVAGQNGREGRDALAQASEALLGTFERLTEHYEHSLKCWWAERLVAALHQNQALKVRGMVHGF